MFKRIAGFSLSGNCYLLCDLSDFISQVFGLLEQLLTGLVSRWARFRSGCGSLTPWESLT